MYAKRLNKTYAVNTAQEKQEYLARGYDIYDDNNELLENSPQKSVPYSEYERLLTQHKLLQNAYKELEAVYTELLARVAHHAAPDESPVLNPEATKMGSLSSPATDTKVADTETVNTEAADAPSLEAPKMGKRK